MLQSQAKIFPSKYILLSLIAPLSVNTSVLAQTSTQLTDPQSTIGNNSNNNNVLQAPIQTNVQTPVQNQNSIRIPNIYPLQNPIFTPVNTENDFGFNLSVGVNTLDASNVTAYVGIIFQPGRTEDHNTRITRLQKETELLEANKSAIETQIILLQQQIEEGKLRLEQLRQASQALPTPAMPGKPTH